MLQSRERRLPGTQEIDPSYKSIALKIFEGFWHSGFHYMLKRFQASTKYRRFCICECRRLSPEVALLEKRVGGKKEIWEICVDKAEDWLAGLGIDEEEAVEGYWEKAEKLHFST